MPQAGLLVLQLDESIHLSPQGRDECTVDRIILREIGETEEQWNRIGDLGVANQHQTSLPLFRDKS
jgi:hypothetical protein